MQPLIEIANGNPPHFAVMEVVRDQSRLEIEVRRPLESEPALTDVALILGGIVRDSHVHIVYTISSTSARPLEMPAHRR